MGVSGCLLIYPLLDYFNIWVIHILNFPVSQGDFKTVLQALLGSSAGPGHIPIGYGKSRARGGRN